MTARWEGPAELRQQFLLDPEIAFLNHGSFGACPRPVLARQGELRTRLEQEPVRFLHHGLPEWLAEARAVLAGALDCPSSELAYQVNVTAALNLVIRCLPLEAGDEILLGHHEYGALLRAWQAEAGRRGLRIRLVELPWPRPTAEAIVQAFEAAAGPATRVLFFSHISSPTALRLPAEELVALARRCGWTSLVDGAHAPGQLPLSIRALDADVYAGNCHKWLLAPKGCGFLQVPARQQAWVEPLVTSWGNQNRPEAERRSAYLDELEWAGTTDPCAWLALPAALEFRRRWDWDERAARCRERLQEWGDQLCARLGLERVTVRDPSLQMLALGLPPLDAAALHGALFERFGVEVPVHEFRGQPLLRVSLQAYNREADLMRLEQALEALLPR